MKYLISMPPVFSHEVKSLYEPVLLEAAFFFFLDKVSL